VAPDDPAYVQDAAYFEARYAAHPDPWGVEERWDERRKRALVLALLPAPRYRRGLEPGCGNGALTLQLAHRCDQLVAYDVLDEPLARARKRTADIPNVTILRGRLPELWPGGSGDLVVLSEVAHYLSPAAADAAAVGLRRWLDEGGAVVAVHRRDAEGYPRTAADVHAWLDALPFLERTAEVRDGAHEAGVWRRRHTPA
jgi:SAM-dependent methyltransferase